MVGASIDTRSAAVGRRLAEGRELDLAGLGTVYGVILNSVAEASARAVEFSQPPHGAPPLSPVLYIKSPNTRLADGGVVAMPEGVDRLEVNAVLAVIIG